MLTLGLAGAALLLVTSLRLVHGPFIEDIASLIQSGSHSEAVVAHPLGDLVIRDGYDWRGAYVTIAVADRSLRLERPESWGPDLTLNVYLSGGEELAFLGAAGEVHIVRLPQLSVLHEPTTSDANWSYVGVFMNDGHGKRFFRANERAECIPSYMEGDPGLKLRQRYWRRNCAGTWSRPAAANDH